jgi:hypothetical protein
MLIDTILESTDKTLPRFCSNHTREFLPLAKKYNFTYNPYYFDLLLTGE